MKTVFEKIILLLQERAVPFTHKQHEPTRSSEESARARGEDLKNGAKAMILKIDDGFKLFVLSAAKKIDSRALKDHFASHKVRFATPDEIQTLTGLVPGSIPPFGKPILPFELYIDRSILANDIVCFNAGSLTDSIVIAQDDYLRVVKGTVLAFSL